MTGSKDRLIRARWSVEGLSTGDAFGENLFFQGVSQYSAHPLEKMIEERILPSSRWSYTDDTQMALSIVEVLRRCGDIDQDQLARSFAHRFEPQRGYGPAMYKLIPQFQAGRPWEKAARSLFSGQGSFGNGGAMRVAPVGAFFADDLDAVVENARAWAWRLRGADPLPKAQDFLELVLPSIPESQVREGVVRACKIPSNTSIVQVQ